MFPSNKLVLTNREYFFTVSYVLGNDYLFSVSESNSTTLASILLVLYRLSISLRKKFLL